MAQVPDTTQYLVDSIQPKLNSYIGQPLKTFISSLKIRFVDFQTSSPVWKKGIGDTVKVTHFYVSFYTLQQNLNRQEQGLKSPGFRISFVTPISIPKTWLMRGGYLAEEFWEKKKERCFENYVIGDILIQGI